MDVFILEQPKQQFEIQSHFGIFGPVIVDGEWYDDTASQDHKCMCELFGNIWSLYSMKSIIYLCKTLVDAELIYNLSSLSNCDYRNVFSYDWSNMALIHVFHLHGILFMLLVCFVYFCMYLLRDVSTIHTFTSTFLAPMKPPWEIDNIRLLCSYCT